MCGIIGVKNGNLTDAEDGLERLIYRGYDSWGFASPNQSNHEVGEFEGDSGLWDEDTVIGHTRWATHGEVTKINTHPHTDCTDQLQVIHNGTISNHDELREELESHTFVSDTDTEVIPHFIEEVGHIQKGLRKFDEVAEGNYAILVLDTETEELYALKQGSPLVYAEEKGTHYFASDLYAISDKTDTAYFMQDGDLISTDGENDVEQQEFDWTEEEPELEDYDYWMEKEIYEQPDALRDLRDSVYGDQKEVHSRLYRMVRSFDQVVLTGSGTSYHATLIGAYVLNQDHIDAQTLIASEFQNYERVDEDTLVIAVSQSGETRDVLDAIEYAKDQGATVASLVNVPYSTIERKSEVSMRIKAGQEICVAATKTFSNTVYALMLIAGRETEDMFGLLERKIPQLHQIAEAQAVPNENDFYIIGENISYPIAREISLKMKEIAYVHSEGMMAGELKHGTLALIEEDTKVLALNSLDGHMDTTIEEIESRGGDVRELLKEDTEMNYVFKAVTYGFLLALETGKAKDLPVDRPRNLAKSVTTL